MDIEGFQNVFLEIQKLLDPNRGVFGGDYRSLASKFGMKQKDITYLDKIINPTEIILKQCNPTLAQLLYHLLSGEEMERRSDVVDVITEWLKKNCGCVNCASTR